MEMKNKMEKGEISEEPKSNKKKKKLKYWHKLNINKIILVMKRKKANTVYAKCTVLKQVF